MSTLTSEQMALYEKDMYPVMNEQYKRKQTKYQEIYSLKSDATGAGDKDTQLLGAGGSAGVSVDSLPVLQRA